MSAWTSPEYSTHPREVSLSQAPARWLKRSVDVILSGFGLVILSPVLLLISIAIRLDSPGPVFYWHPRIGRRGKVFKMMKFRTMYIDAQGLLWEQLLKKPELKTEWDRFQKLKDDPRVTRVGKVLRRLSLDELPQLWNVLSGSMSIVGPRPLTVEQRTLCGDYYQDYIIVTPGITGMWQVSGRNDIPFQDRMVYDRRYLWSWSIFLDLWIILKTLWVVLRGKGY